MGFAKILICSALPSIYMACIVFCNSMVDIKASYEQLFAIFGITWLLSIVFTITHLFHIARILERMCRRDYKRTLYILIGIGIILSIIAYYFVPSKYFSNDDERIMCSFFIPTYGWLMSIPYTYLYNRMLKKQVVSSA